MRRWSASNALRPFIMPRRVWVPEQPSSWPSQRGRASVCLPALLKSFASRYPHPPHGGSMLRVFARRFAWSGLLILFPLFVQAQVPSFSIGTATAAPGQKINRLFGSPCWCRCGYQHSRHRHQRRKAWSCPGSCRSTTCLVITKDARSVCVPSAFPG